MKPLLPRSEWLLRYCYERMVRTGGGGYCNHLALPADAPSGLCMQTMRGLEKRGLVEEFVNGCFRPTAEGLKYLQEHNNENNKPQN